MAKKGGSLVKIVVPLSLAVAILSLFVTIFLILINPSQFPVMVKSKQQTPTIEQIKPEVVSRLAKQDLAKRLAITVDQIVTVSVEKKSWSDSSLGCPQPGFVYAQVITPGYQIILQANGETYDYRSDLERHVLLCTQDLPGDIGTK